MTSQIPLTNTSLLSLFGTTDCGGCQQESYQDHFIAFGEARPRIEPQTTVPKVDTRTTKLSVPVILKHYMKTTPPPEADALNTEQSGRVIMKYTMKLYPPI